MPLVNMTEMLRAATKQRYAVGSFNTFNVEMTKGVVDAATKLRAPVILAYGEVFGRLFPMEQYAAYIRRVADDANVPVALLLDHASRLDSVMRALDCGFTSIMVDVSDKPLHENIAVTLKAKKLCERYGASLESEIGHVPGLEADYDSSLQDDFSAHTDAEEARLFISETGVDALAISIGTAHGFYHGEPSLDFGRLHELREALDVPLVVHGASGLGHDDYYRCVEGGISKFNIHTDLTQAALDFVNKDGQDEKNYMEKCLGTAGAVEALAANLIHVFGSAGKA